MYIQLNYHLNTRPEETEASISNQKEDCRQPRRDRGGSGEWGHAPHPDFPVWAISVGSLVLWFLVEFT